MRQLIASPLNAVLLISFLYCIFWHGKLGLQTIIEDYVHHRPLEITLLLLVKYSAFLCAAAGILAVLRIAL
jgi:succinate dehydrogenase / fumarate reductase membrane anchor subunit